MLRRLVRKLWLLGVLVCGSAPREGRWMLLCSGHTVRMAGVRLGMRWPMGVLVWCSRLGRPLWRWVTAVPTWAMVLRHRRARPGVRSWGGRPGLRVVIWSKGWVG